MTNGRRPWAVIIQSAKLGIKSDTPPMGAGIDAFGIDDYKFLVVAFAIGEAEIVLQISRIIIRDDEFAHLHAADRVQQVLDVGAAEQAAPETHGAPSCSAWKGKA
jgi:hypothetical protein